ncbi:MAG: hypothetical protein MI725_13215 [Pirellulales bacterium]|nr:hypothetical protein [Pirellulales bacterium]
MLQGQPGLVTGADTAIRIDPPTGVSLTGVQLWLMMLGSAMDGKADTGTSVIRFLLAANAIRLVPASFFLFLGAGAAWKLSGVPLFAAAVTLQVSASHLAAREKRSLSYYRASVTIIVVFGLGVSVAMLNKTSDFKSLLSLILFALLAGGAFWAVDAYIREILRKEKGSREK